MEKVYEFVTGLVIFNVFLIIFSTLGVFPTLYDLYVNEETFAMTNAYDLIGMISSFGFASVAGILGTFGASVIVARYTNTSPYVSLAYGIMCGTILFTLVSLLGIINNIANALPLESSKEVVMTMRMIILSVIGIEFVFGLIQMAVGGFKAHA